MFLVARWVHDVGKASQGPVKFSWSLLSAERLTTKKWKATSLLGTLVATKCKSKHNLVAVLLFGWLLLLIFIILTTSVSRILFQKIKKSSRKNQTDRKKTSAPRTFLSKEEEEPMVEEVQKISRFNNLLFHNLSYNL